MTSGHHRGEPTTERAVRWRFLVLTGLRWVPVGFLAPVLVLLALSRGLSLPQVGLVFAVYGATTATLELPTGGFADAFGRKLTLAASSVSQLAFLALLVGADRVGWWLAAAVMGGVARALDSGPLQAWYVDEARRLEPGVVLRPGLAAHGVVEGAGLALSAVAGGILPAVAGGHGLVVVVWAALAVQLVHLVAVLVLMREHRHAEGARVAWREGVRQVPAVVRGGLGQAVRRGPIRLLMLSTVAWGVTLAGIEVLWQPRFVSLMGGDPDAPVSDAQTVVLGVLLAVGFLLAAGGSSLTTRFARLAGGSASRAALLATLLQGAALAVLAAAALVVPAAFAFVAFYFVNGLRGPVHYELLHEHVDAAQRSTLLSVESLSLQVGGFFATLLLPTVAAASSIPWAWGGVAAIVVASALLYRAVPDRPAAVPPRVADQDAQA